VPCVSQAHHARHLRLKAVLLLLWLLVTFVTSYFARDLQMLVGGWTLGYWMAAQGAVLVFIAIVVAYAWGMSYFERQDTAASHD
jgi:putative solute:sodium symporter small subunit